MNQKDCYKTLGLSEGASLEQINKARRELARQWHPDRLAHNPILQLQAEEKLKEINAAYDFIKLYPSISQSEHPSSQSVRSKPASNGSDSSGVDDRARKREEQNRRQAEEARIRQQQEQQAARAAEQQAARAAEQQARQRAQQEAEAAQRTEQHRQQEAARRSKVNHLRFWGILILLIIIAWHYSSSNQASSSQQSRPPTPGIASTAPMPVDDRKEVVPSPVTKDQLAVQINNTSASNAQWQRISQSWANGDNGRNVIGSNSKQLHILMGQPSLGFRRGEGLTEEMWFGPNSAGYISIVLKNGTVVQVETEVQHSGDPELTPDVKYLSLGDVRRNHSILAVSAYVYDMYDFVAPKDQPKEEYNAAATIWEAKVHFQGDVTIYYYDDIQKGVAFALGVQDSFDSKIPIDKIIVHKRGMAVVPASFGKPSAPIDERPG